MKIVMTLITFIFLKTSLAWSQDIFKISTNVGSEKFESLVYKPTGKIRAIVIISPSIGGVDALETQNAEYFSRHGFVSIVLFPVQTELGTTTPNTLNIDKDYFKPAISADAILKKASEKLLLSSSLPVFAAGASQGGIYSVIIASHLERVKGAWVTVAGGDLPHIYSQSTIGPIANFRTRHMKALGIKENDLYESYLRNHLKNDPLISCQNMKASFMQIIALRDDIVPTKSQERLATECPNHEVSRYNVVHGSGTLLFYTLRAQIRDFFEGLI